jgi:hypothetical protein
MNAHLISGRTVAEVNQAMRADDRNAEHDADLSIVLYAGVIALGRHTSA